MGLRQNILNEPVSELELRELLVVQPTTTVRQAVQLMQQKKLGCVIIIDGNGNMLGKFTERQLIHLLLTKPAGLDDPVLQHKSPHFDCVKITDPIAKVIDRMENSKLRFVCVLDENGKPVGLTGQKGVMEFITEHFSRQVKVQETDAKLYMDQREGA